MTFTAKSSTGEALSGQCGVIRQSGPGHSSCLGVPSSPLQRFNTPPSQGAECSDTYVLR